ncbi:unnamed protein product [Durusdinium trenchii]|uniref:Uncharacterized protein n=1 Tax=Durusdinium trenchii TaxID=1381693 RepID=A0ABP0PJF2_9DINO
MASAIGVMARMLFAAAFVAASPDPLAQWLDSLKFSLEDDVGLSITLQGVGISCTGHFDYHGLAIVSGSGDLSAVVKGSPTSTATVALKGMNFNKNLPWSVEAAACDANLDIDLKLQGSIVYDVINLFSKPISALIKHQAISQACGQLKQMAANELSKKLSDFNRLMLPPSELFVNSVATSFEDGDSWFHTKVHSFDDLIDAKHDVADLKHDAPAGHLRVAEYRRLQAEEKSGTVDWSHDASLSSFMLELLLALCWNGLGWAVKGNETIVIPGPETPLMTTTVKQPDAGLELKVTAFLKSASIEGADGMSAFSPVEAVGSNDLRFKVSWGTAERPAFGFGVDVKLEVEAVDLSSGKSQASMEQEMSLHLAVLKPSLEVLGEVQVLASEWPGTRSLAQLLVAPKECLTSVLKQTPAVKSLQMKFENLAAPLSFITHTQGALENAVANLLNNGVGLFNQVYQPLLPGAIQRFAACDKTVQSLNKALQQQMKPGRCIDPALASQQVRNVFPEHYSNWPPIFDNFMRQWIDNFFDGFIAHNTSVLDGLGNMPQLDVPLKGKVTLRQLIATGLNQVSELRVLLPSSEHPSWLGNKAVAKCPTEQAPYHPTFAVNGSLFAGVFGGDGLVSLEMPCGTMEAELDVVVDFWQLMDTQIPPSLTCALLSPFSKMDIMKVNATWGGNGRVLVQPKDGPAQYPVEQMCTMHPDACKYGDQMREWASTTEGATRLYHMARDTVKKQCTSPQLAEKEDSAFFKDQLGYTYVTPDNLMLWLGSALVILALAATYTFAATLGRLMSTDTCESADLMPNTPLAAWTARPGGLGCLPTTSSSSLTMESCTITLMAAGLVARVLACFWLPFAATGVTIEQKTGGTIFKNDTLLQYTFFGGLSKMIRTCQLRVQNEQTICQFHLCQSSMSKLAAQPKKLSKQRGIGQQFLLGGSLYCQILWFFMSMAFTCHAIMLLVWLTPFLAPYRRKLLMVALVLGRFALSEAETTGNTAMVLSNDVALPLGMVQKLYLGLEAGAYTSWAATVFTVLANLLLLKIDAGHQLLRGGGRQELFWRRCGALRRCESETPWPDAPCSPKEWAEGKAPRYVTAVQAVSCVAMVAGICVWYFCDFMHAETGGLAGALIPPANYSGSGLGKTDLSLRILVIVTAGLCPLMHILAFAVGCSGKSPTVAQGLATMAASFCLLDLFAIGFLATFLEGVNGFASSAVHDFAKPMCELVQEALNQDCLTMTASVVPLGTIGLLLATSAWSALVAVQVMGFGQKRRAGEVAPVQAELRAQQPPSFQECEECDVDLFLVMPRVIWLRGLSKPPQQIQVFKSLLPHRFHDPSLVGESWNVDEELGNFVLFFRHVNSTLMSNWRAVGSHIAERSAWDPWLRRGRAGNAVRTP